MAYRELRRLSDSRFSQRSSSVQVHDRRRICGDGTGSVSIDSLTEVPGDLFDRLLREGRRDRGQHRLQRGPRGNHLVRRQSPRKSLAARAASTCHTSDRFSDTHASEKLPWPPGFLPDASEKERSTLGSRHKRGSTASQRLAPLETRSTCVPEDVATAKNDPLEVSQRQRLTSLPRSHIVPV